LNLLRQWYNPPILISLNTVPCFIVIVRSTSIFFTKQTLAPSFLILAIFFTAKAVVANELLTLEAAVYYTLKHKSDLLAVEEQVTSAHQQFLASDAASQPVINFSYSARVSDNPLDAFADKLFTQTITTQDFVPDKLNNPNSSELFITSLSMRWPIYSGGKIEARQLRSHVAYQQRKLLLQRAQQKSVYATTQAYLYVIAARKALKIAQQAELAYKHHADSTAKLARQGRIVESDKLSAQVNLAAVKARRTQSQTRYKHALSRLKQAIGMPVNKLISVNSDWPDIQVLQDNLDTLYKQAEINRIDILAATKAIDSAKANVEESNAENKPNVNLVASSNWYDDQFGFDSQSSSLMVIASYKLFDGSIKGKLGSAKAQYKEQLWRKQALQRSILSEVKLARDDLLEAQSRIAIAKDNVVLAKKTVRLVKRRYGRGRTILLDLLQSERMYTEARMEKLTSEFNLRASRLALLNAVGVLDIPKDQ